MYSLEIKLKGIQFQWASNIDGENIGPQLVNSWPLLQKHVLGLFLLFPWYLLVFLSFLRPMKNRPNTCSRIRVNFVNESRKLVPLPRRATKRGAKNGKLVETWRILNSCLPRPDS